MTRAVLPRVSSSTSGLIFCGMIDEPVQNACGSRRKPNSTVDHRIHSSAQVLRCSAIEGQGEREFDGEVAVARRIEAVGDDALEAQRRGDVAAVDGDRRAGQRGRAERQLIHAAAAIGQPLAVALEFFGVGQPVVGGQHRLGPLQVRVARQDHAGVAVAAADERPLHVGEQAVGAVDRVADPQPQVGRHLVVAAAAGVQLAADVAEPVDEGPLDVHVDVFQLLAEDERAGGDLGADLLQAGDDLVGLVGGEHADRGQHPGVGDRAADVVGVEAAVEADAFGEPLDAGIGVRLKHAAPGFFL